MRKTEENVVELLAKTKGKMLNWEYYNMTAYKIIG